jgi:cold shock CspA family protein
MFDHDKRLAGHSRSLQPTPRARRQSKQRKEVSKRGSHTGKVSRINPRGFSFIKPDNGGADVFCHDRTLKRSGISAAAVSVGDRLAFDVVPSQFKSGRMEADNVTFANDKAA